LPTDSKHAIFSRFLGNEDKVFVMIVDQSIGTAITMFMQGTKKERPLTHDLLANILRALGGEDRKGDRQRFGVKNVEGEEG
jgi:bifunctional DNase/RNase